MAIGQHRDGLGRTLLPLVLSAAGSLFFGCGCLGFTPSPSETVSGSVVVGFERFYKGNEAKADGGELLISELGCVSCHQVDDELFAGIGRSQAPLLESVGSRLNPEYLEKFVSDPSSVQPGTRMPGLFVQWPQEERSRAVRDLTSFLASQGGPFQNHGSPLSSDESERGEKLYHSVGCVACHAPLRPPGPEPGGDKELYQTVQIETP